jgi:hypothetical protein
MEEKRLFIIARYNENIEWVENLEGDINIYNKGKDFPFPYPRVDVPNIGRESETFVRGIVENYEILNNYDSMVFLQGQPFDHCPDLFEKLQVINSFNLYEGLSKSFTSHELPDNELSYIFNKNVYVFEKLINIQKTQIQYHIKNLQTESLYTANNELEELMFVLDFMNLPYKGLVSYWATGAQYLVPVKYISNKSLEWWTELLRFIHYCYEYLEWHTLGYVLERIWPLIWSYKTK